MGPWVSMSCSFVAVAMVGCRLKEERLFSRRGGIEGPLGGVRAVGVSWKMFARSSGCGRRVSDRLGYSVPNEHEQNKEVN